ncbi:hypothetical protein LHJ74_23850 [Streptomyces sp. N2-109]|uniref:Lipoprotein n=1 Tax=Streptomyces gossypii TaxID=2883101 RepID=A0ABT2JZV0_9ACTN|nr:hypothetical protein [Streptomyces gossypii]MCT2592909.1 hypothetical protein [Streptomyces gossypii]
MVGRRCGRWGAALAALTGLGATLVCTLGGCVATRTSTTGSPAGDPLLTVRQAAEVLERAGTSRTRTVVRTVSGGTRVTIKGTGVFDYRRRIGRIQVTLPREPSGAPAAEPITELVIPGALYMKNRGAGVPAGKWVRVDTSTLPDGNLLANGATDPLSAAELLRGTREVAYVGRRRVADGAVVRHYSGTTDIRKAAHASSGGVRRQLRAAAEGFAGDAVPFDAYLDGRGRLREVRHWFTLDAEAGDAASAVASTTTMYDFGIPVEVGTPAPVDLYTGEIEAS